MNPDILEKQNVDLDMEYFGKYQHMLKREGEILKLTPLEDETTSRSSCKIEIVPQEDAGRCFKSFKEKLIFYTREQKYGPVVA